MSNFVSDDIEAVGESLPEGWTHDAVNNKIDGAVEGVEVAHQRCGHHHPQGRPTNKNNIRVEFVIHIFPIRTIKMTSQIFDPLLSE
jgi:hypothetical protein